MVDRLLPLKELCEILNEDEGGCFLVSLEGCYAEPPRAPMWLL